MPEATLVLKVRIRSKHQQPGEGMVETWDWRYDSDTDPLPIIQKIIEKWNYQERHRYDEQIADIRTYDDYHVLEEVTK